MSTSPSSGGPDSAVRKGVGWLPALGVAGITGGILIAVNMIFHYVPARLDFTANKSHTLTQGTINILKRVDTETKLTLFVSPEDDLPPQARPMVAEVRAWLTRYHEMNPDNVTVQIREVEPASDEQQEAAAAGIDPQNGSLYFGISATCLDRTASIPWVPKYLSQNGEPDQIEFAISNAVSEVIRTKKKIIGLMSPLPVGGTPSFGGRGAPEWYISQALKSQYEVKTIDVKASSIDKDLDALVLIHPAGITDEAQWAVEQYLLGGGHVVAFLDPFSYVASVTGQQQGPMGGASTPTGSSLPKLLGTWGYNFDDTKILADMGYQTRFNRDVASPLLITPDQTAINKNEDISRQLTDFWMVFSGGFTGSPASGLEETVFLKSSPQNQLVDTSYAQAQPNSPDGIKKLNELTRNFKPAGQEKLLAFRIRGNFKSSFPAGKPAPPPPAPEGGNGMPAGFPGFGGPNGPEGETGAAAPVGDGASVTTPPVEVPPPAAETAPANPEPALAAPEIPAPAVPAPAPAEGATPALPVPPTAAPTPAPAESAPAGEAKPAEGEAAKPADDGTLKESVKPGEVYLIADSDMLADFLSPQILQNSNLPLALNIIDDAAGDRDLMSVRSRGSSRRPFSYINSIQEEAEKKIRQDVSGMQEELNKINEDIGQSKSAKERNEAIFKGLKDFEKKQRELNKKIYEKQKEARKEVRGKTDMIKWLNIVVMPGIVALAGILVWVSRRIKTSAR